MKLLSETKQRERRELMVERAGGELRSRQTMAAIIYLAENRD